MLLCSVQRVQVKLALTWSYLLWVELYEWLVKSVYFRPDDHHCVCLQGEMFTTIKLLENKVTFPFCYFASIVSKSWATNLDMASFNSKCCPVPGRLRNDLCKPYYALKKVLCSTLKLFEKIGNYKNIIFFGIIQGGCAMPSIHSPLFPTFAAVLFKQNP